MDKIVVYVMIQRLRVCQRICCWTALLFCLPIFAEDILHLKSGEVMRGRFIEMQGNDVKFETGGIRRFYDRAQICRMILDATGDSGLSKECEDIIIRPPAVQTTRPQERAPEVESRPDQTPLLPQQTQQQVRERAVDRREPDKSFHRGPFYFSLFGGTGRGYGSFVDLYKNESGYSMDSAILITDPDETRQIVGAYNIASSPDSIYRSRDAGFSFAYGMTEHLHAGLSVDTYESSMKNAPYRRYDGVPYMDFLANMSLLSMRDLFTYPVRLDELFLAVRGKIEFPGINTYSFHLGFRAKLSNFEPYFDVSGGTGAFNGHYKFSPQLYIDSALSFKGKAYRYEASAGIRIFATESFYFFTELHQTSYFLSYRVEGTKIMLVYFPFNPSYGLGGGYIPLFAGQSFEDYKKSLFYTGLRFGVGFRI